MVLISAIRCAQPSTVVQLEGLSKLKNTVTSLGIELPTFRLYTL
jgi:hypothetical protein